MIGSFRTLAPGFGNFFGPGFRKGAGIYGDYFRDEIFDFLLNDSIPGLTFRGQVPIIVGRNNAETLCGRWNGDTKSIWQPIFPERWSALKSCQEFLASPSSLPMTSTLERSALLLSGMGSVGW